ncbi:MAG TPA: ABC transporter ATP-binding protein [Chloroflexia bacterium]|nr:ABC transporter ATP-binding protein [Chloroflexia bacterium]
MNDKQSSNANKLLAEGREVNISYANDSSRPFTAVENVSFRVWQGEKLVLIGPSGCGKSTLLKALAGFVPISGGELLSCGSPVTSPGPDRAVVFQEFDQLFPWQTVQGNLLYALKRVKNVSGKTAVARAQELLELVGIGNAADKYPHMLSGGMKMRVAIARALALEPRMLLLDEPFAALDAITRRQLQFELNRIWKQTGLTLLMVTHSIEEAVFLGHRVLVMTPAPSTVRETVDTRAVEDFDDPRFSHYVSRLNDLLVHPEQVDLESKRI